MDYKEIIFSQTNSIGILTLNTPKKINTLSLQKIQEMIRVLEKIAIDDSVKVLVLKANGNHFCAGHDLSEMVDQGTNEYKHVFD